MLFQHLFLLYNVVACILTNTNQAFLDFTLKKSMNNISEIGAVGYMVTAIFLVRVHELIARKKAWDAEP